MDERSLEINNLKRKQKPLWRVTANKLTGNEYSAVIQIRGPLLPLETGSLKYTLAFHCTEICKELISDETNDQTKEP